jgi:hypothetical protein
MATTTEVSTKEQVKALMDEGLDAGQIAEQLGKTKATIYVHMRNLKAEAGEKPRGRGRPPKVQQDGTAAAATKSRPAPPKAGPATSSAAKSESNGHAPEFPEIVAGIERELARARATVTRLERMLETATK